MEESRIVKTEIQSIGASELLKRFDNMENSIESLKDTVQGNPETTILDRKEVSKLFSISLPTLHSWCKKGVLPSYRIGNKVRFRQSEVLQAMKLIKHARSSK